MGKQGEMSGDEDGSFSGSEARKDEEAASSGGKRGKPFSFSRKWPDFTYLLDLERVKPKESVTQIIGLKDAATSKLFKEYQERLESIAPELRGMGRSVGNRMLETLKIPMNDTVDQEWRESLGIYPELTQSVVKPVLQPFCDGLWEPFEGFLGQYKTELYLTVAAGAATGLVAGFLIGRHSKK